MRVVTSEKDLRASLISACRANPSKAKLRREKERERERELIYLVGIVCTTTVNFRLKKKLLKVSVHRKCFITSTTSPERNWLPEKSLLIGFTRTSHHISEVDCAAISYHAVGDERSKREEEEEENCGDNFFLGVGERRSFLEWIFFPL